MTSSLLRCFTPHYNQLFRRTMFKQLDRNSNEIKTLFSDDVIWLCNIFLKKGFEIRIVGGAVRDMLMKCGAKDIDLSTTATPNQMIDVFKEHEIRYIETGLQHGTLTAHLKEQDFEVTTLRIDVETYGRKAKVEFTHDWRLDALRRDLTINAMSLDVNGVLYDYFEGEKDLKDGKVRFVGNADQRIREDYLRILRYFRFYGRIAPDVCHHDEVTLRIIKDLACGLKQVAVERIWLEFNRIITGNYAPHLLKLIYELNVAASIGLPQVTEKHFQEFEKVWINMRCHNPHPISILTSLVNTEVEAEDLCLKWKLSTFDKTLACFIASNRYQSSKVNPTNPIKFYQDILVKKSSPKNLSLIREHVRELLNYEGHTRYREELENWTVPKFPLTGADLKKQGVKQGPIMGKVINTLKDSWIESYYTLSKEVLINDISTVYESVQHGNAK